MHLIKPINPGAVNALTGAPLPAGGVVREVLLPADHYAQRVGEVSITAQTAAPAKAVKAKQTDQP